MRHPIRPQNGPFLGGFDSSRTETRRCVFSLQKREKTATPTVGDKSSPDEPLRAWDNASPASRGYWGYWGYFSQTLENAGFFERPRGGYFGGYFLGRGYSWGYFLERGFPRARYPFVCASLASRCYRGTPIAKTPNSGGVRTGRHPIGSTCERQPFPFWQRFGISEPSPRRSLTPVNSFSRRILETSRLDFLNHSLARA